MARFLPVAEGPGGERAMTGGAGRMRTIAAAMLAACLGGTNVAGGAAAREPYHLIPGAFTPNREPDGNSIFLDAPRGLILIDTGRHPEQQARLIAYARRAGRPIAAIVNTHWHLDHSGGNAEIKAAFPHAKLYASRAIEGALKGFLPRSRAEAERYLASGRATAGQAADMKLDFAAMDAPRFLRPDVPIARSAWMSIAGRRLRVNLAPYAATEGDVWIYDPATRTVFAGDLVVPFVPFLDTACPEAWRRALERISATPFTTLVPGHGDPMTHAQFETWRRAYGNFLDCAASSRSKDECVAGWKRDAASFIPAGLDAGGMAAYYLDTRLRAAPAERDRYCPGSTG
jgi:glyoxylase-like metal-dependent hydrolase (beta-lactamase superfamily II)